VPLVVTIHDLAVLRYPDTFNRWTRVYSRLLLPQLARAATRVIAVSEFTAREAVELLGVDERRSG
jgi:Glycosyltransferase Family 4